MFKHILLPTDGSSLSEVAIQNGIKLAKSINARVTGFFVLPEFRMVTYRPEMLSETKAQYAEASRARAKQYLEVIEKAARDAGVTCETVSATGDQPHKAIIDAAQDRGCDLIMMASHGRRGVRSILLGSETLKVLTHSKIPVLVCRERRRPRSRVLPGRRPQPAVERRARTDRRLLTLGPDRE